VVGGAAWVLRRTVLGTADPGGRRERARGAAGRRAGGRVKRLVYAISGALAGLAGWWSSPSTPPPTPTSSGLGWSSMPSRRSAVGGTLLAGGRATVLGTLVGALIIQLPALHPAGEWRAGCGGAGGEGGVILLAVWVQRRGR
jgi:ribose transport system permease protein